MNKLLLSCLFAGVAVSMSATVTLQSSLTTDFLGTYQRYESMPAGWTGLGVDAKPDFSSDPSYESLYANYSATNAFKLLGWSNGTMAAAFSPSAFKDANGEQILSDQWLISPEFEVKEDQEMLYFTACAFGNTIKNAYTVYISTNGSSKEEFMKTPLLSANLVGEKNSVNTGSRRIVLDGYAGKKVRLAFVNNNNKSGQVGFTEIGVAPYYMSFTNASSLNQFIVTDNATKLPVQFKISTPVTAKGVTAVLELSNGQTSTYTNTTSISKSKVTSMGFFMPDPLQVSEDCTFTLTITPNYEGAPATVVTGQIVMAERLYDPSVLVEELTGSWCQFCPRGIAYMEYYKDKYNSLGKGKVIPLMLHYGDMMQVDPTYQNSVINTMNTVGTFPGFPSCLVNRSEVGDPGDVNVNGLMAVNSFGKVEILKTSYDPSKSNAIALKCSAKVGYSALVDAGINALFVVYENNVRGDSSDWDQIDAYGQYGMAVITQNYGAEVAPYFEPFVNRPGNVVPFTDMVYPDVARGIYPSYEGENLDRGGWEKDSAKEFILYGEMPESVMVKENTAVAVILTRRATGEVIGCDFMNYADWSDDFSNVSDLKNEADFLAIPVAGGLGLKLSSDARVEVVSLDGTILFAGDLKAGETVLSLAKGQAVVVRATNGESTATRKVLL